MKHKALSREKLKTLIVEFFQSQGLCVLATCGRGKPRATPVEYFPDGLTLYVLTEGGRKLENIQENPEVSVAVSTAWLGWERSKGVQVSGRAVVGEAGSKIFREGVRAFRRRPGRAKASVPDVLKVIKIIPYEVEYLDLTLKSRGYGVLHMLKVR
jgi:hypothetical protein